MRAFSLLVLLVLSGCIATLRPTEDAIPEGDAFLEVENLSDRNLVIYVLTAGGSTALGSVPELSTRRFKIGRALIGAAQPLQIAVAPHGGPQVATSLPFFVDPGQVARSIMRPGLTMMDVTIR